MYRDVLETAALCNWAFDYWGKGTAVTVTSATQEAPKSLFPVWQCGSSPDGFVTLGCVTRDLATPDGLSYVWKDASGTALTTNVVQYPAVSEGGKYSSVSQARVSANDWNANKLFTCEVTNPQGTKTAQLKKPVVPDIPAKSLLLTAPTQTELENGTAIFICLASEFSPKTSTFKWTRGQTNLDNKAKDPILIAGKPTYSSFSILKLTAAEWMGSTSPVKCEFQQKSQTLSKEASYAPCDQEQPKIKIIPPSNSDILITRSGDLVCKAEGPVGFTGIKWIGKGGKEVASLPEKDVSTKAEISLTTSISYEEWSSGTKFTCEVHHSSFPQGFITEVYKRENGRSPICPGFFLLPPPESSNEDTKTLTCYIKNFYPKEVAVSWLIGDKPVNSESITNVIEKNGNFTAYSQLIVDKDAWGNGTTFTCNVYHESILEIVHHISRSLTGNSNPPSLVNLSLNVPQNCPNPEHLVLTDLFYNETEIDEDNVATTALTFVFLFLITLFYSIGVTVIKKALAHCAQRVYFSFVTQITTFVPEVTETPPNISISTSFDTTTNDTNLICWLDGFSPKGINVDWGAGKKGTEKKFQNEGKKEFAMLSQISINAQQWKEGKEFTCSATHKTKTVSQTWSICKGHPISEPRIRLEKPPLRSILTDTHVTVSCLVETVFQPTISWLVNGNRKSGTYIKSERQGESTVSNLTIPVEEWTKSNTITCQAEHPCFKTIEDQIKRTENVQKRPSDLRPTVEIRRSLADIGKRDSAVLECVASGLPSGELSVTFQANDEKFPEAQYMNLPEGQDTLVAPFTIPGTHRTKSYSFTCQIQLSDSLKWKSNSTGNLFDDPSVELSVQSSKSASTTQKLLCYGTGLNPEIKWLPQSIGNSVSEESMNKDGRVKASSELSVTEQEWKRGTTFTCQVRDQGGLKTAQKNISVCAVTPDHARKAQIYLLRPSVSDMQEKDPVSVTFLLLGQRVQDFSVNCKIDEENLTNVIKTENHGNGTESGRMVLKVPAKKWNDHSTVFCVVKHSCFNARTYNISKPKESKPPTIRIRSPSDDELAGSNDTALLCLIEGFLPADISVHWEVDNIKLDASRFKNSGPVQFASGGYSMQSALILSPLKKENGTFSCVVRHQSSTDLIKSEISNIYASVNKNPPSVKLLQSQDELVCLAYDYSPSDISITWLLNKHPVENNDIGSSAKGLDGKFMIKSHLNVKTSKWEPGSTYTCLVQHITGSVSLNVSKAEFIEKAIYIDDNKSDINTVDQAEETWNMACAFIILFVISLIYGCSITLVKVKTA